MDATPLYGGAMSCVVPLGWLDCSAVRPVPDTQEMFFDDASGGCLIVELMQRQQAVPDSDCGSFFFNDLAGANKAMHSEVFPQQQQSSPPKLQIDLDVALDAPRLGSGAFLGDIFCTLVQGLQRVSGPSNAPSDVVVTMGILRLLPPAATDVLVTLSMPTRATSLGREASLGLVRAVIASLAVHDVGLFVAE